MKKTILFFLIPAVTACAGFHGNANHGDQWNDGKPREYIAQDQMVGVLYGVVPQDRAESIMKVFRVDLVDSGDYVPNEHINTLTGENLGFAIQGWNADLFGLMYFGLKNTELKFKL